jgi:hypothetical protein
MLHPVLRGTNCSGRGRGETRGICLQRDATCIDLKKARRGEPNSLFHK